MTIRRYMTPIFALTLLPALSERILAQEIRPDFSVGTPRYFLSDHLGSVRAIVDGNGDVATTFRTEPSGRRQTRITATTTSSEARKSRPFLRQTYTTATPVSSPQTEHSPPSTLKPPVIRTSILTSTAPPTQ